MKRLKFVMLLCVAAACCRGNIHAKIESGFVSLFDGKTLDGWNFENAKGPPYTVKDGVLICPSGAKGNVLSKKEYSDFILRLEFKLTPGANNGIGIRTPNTDGSVAYLGSEIQILDDNDPKYSKLEPAQYCSSVYKVFAAKRGAVNKPGKWNKFEVIAQGRSIKISLNGKKVVDGDINSVADPAILREHPGLFRPRGHIALLSHNDEVHFRNIRIKELPLKSPDNTPPPGFAPLFNGRNLDNWKGLVANPPVRAKMPPAELAAEQARADQKMREHWKAENGVLLFDGKGDNICTARDFGDFEFWVDWKIPAKGDSGIYLRGHPQVQIWEPNSPGQFSPPDGSGGLYNNQKNPRHPLKFADNPPGEWNSFRIIMTGDRLHVYLNGELVVKDTPLENFWEPGNPLPSTGQIELQNHGAPLSFKNIYAREIKPAPPK